jgi:MoaA/NifB/PqqE/SkfB family radical SAM enzyme
MPGLRDRPRGGRRSVNLQQQMRRLLGHRLRGLPRVRGLLKEAEHHAVRYRHAAGSLMVRTIKPRAYKVMIAVTADCNARCQGCRYGRDFMVGHRLDWPMVRDLLDDAAAMGFYSIRFYGGEPLLHPDLPRMVEHCRQRGMRPYITTNAVLLDQKIDDLVAAGLRDITVGFYGVGEAYDAYTQSPGLFRRVERSLAAVRDRHGDRIDVQMNWLLMRPTASVGALAEALDFARRFGMGVRVDLIHYSLPYFQEGPDRCLQFKPEDRPQVEQVVRELLAVKRPSRGS